MDSCKSAASAWTRFEMSDRLDYIPNKLFSLSRFSVIK